MHSFTIHESRNLKQARPKGQYVDLLRRARLLLPHLFHYTILTRSCQYDYFAIIMHLLYNSISVVGIGYYLYKNIFKDIMTSV